MMVISTFALSLFSVAFSPLAKAIPASELQNRACTTVTSDPSCRYLLQRCVSNVDGLWNIDSCLAAATCASVAKVFEAVSCVTGEALLDPKDVPALEHDLYARVVGSCPSTKGNCEITSQNYAHFYYRTLVSEGSSISLSRSKLEEWWSNITSWAGSSDISYTDFNRWLHFSSNPAENPRPPSFGYSHGDQAPDHFLLDNSPANVSHLFPRTSYNYEIDCNVYPNVCENQCYYIYCKNGHWDIHVERTPSSRRLSECAGYNRCSHGRKSGPPPGGWAVNPNKDWSCDEQPKSSTREGGAGSATRCMPATENSAEGAAWKRFINGETPTQKMKLVDGTSVTVVLDNPRSNGLCASYGGKGHTVCPAAAAPPGKNDSVRQR